MDTKSLEIFQHLAGSLHFAKTAKAHHMSPSTLSRLIQRMEEQIGCTLLIRDNRHVKLTTSGEEFLNYADQQLAQWQTLKNKVDQNKQHLTGKLHLFCSVTAAYSHLPKLLDRFRQQHPQVEIMLTTGDAADAISMAQKDKIDIAIAAKPEILSKRIFFSTIDQIPLAIIAPSNSAKIRQQLQQSKIEWSKIPFILPDHGPARVRFNRWYQSQKQSSKPKIYSTVSGHEALVSMVALGCGVGLAPRVVIDNSPVKNRIERVSNVGEIEPFELGVCCLHKKLNQPIVKAFFDTIDEEPHR